MAGSHISIELTIHWLRRIKRRVRINNERKFISCIHGNCGRLHHSHFLNRTITIVYEFLEMGGGKTGDFFKLIG